MVAASKPVLSHRALKWAMVATAGPITGPLALEALRNAEKGDWVAAVGYAATVPCAWYLLTSLAVLL